MSNSNYKTEIDNLSDLSNYIGKEVGLSDWFKITQDDINTFAKLTHVCYLQFPMAFQPHFLTSFELKSRSPLNILMT